MKGYATKLGSRSLRLTNASVKSRADATSVEVAIVLRGRTTPDGHPFDVIKDEWASAIEVKTIQKSSRANGMIQMNARAKQLKREYAARKSLRLFTVVVDQRFDPPNFYVREGVGTFFVKNMQRANDLNEIRLLIRRAVRSGVELIPERIRRRRESRGRSFQILLARFGDAPPQMRYRIIAVTFDYITQGYFTQPRSGRWCWDFLVNELGIAPEGFCELQFRENQRGGNTYAEVGTCYMKSAQLNAGQFVRDPLC